MTITHRKETVPQDLVRRIMTDGRLDTYKTDMHLDHVSTDEYHLATETPSRFSIEGRRILMLAADQVVGDKAQEALEAAGLKVQRASAEGGLRTEDRNGQPTLPKGEVVIVDGGSMQAMGHAQLVAATRAMDAVLTVFDSSMRGSLVDHAMLVTPEDALIDSANVLNLMLDRMTEAQIAGRFGGFDKVPDSIARHMNWLPIEEAKRRGYTPAGTQTVHSMIMTPTGKASRALADYEAQVVCDRMGLPDSVLDGLIGDDVMERERAARHTYVLSDERAMRDIDLVRVDLPKTSGFDHRSHNQAFNLRQGRAGRGTPGRRGGGRK